ncbi:MAG: hypothetical protein GEV28_05790 [Actinophytocola sp.]|uniref:hypothetical protein n=1 Tax=Actinophytocola sp. TaxID=1872138 RepID=UPI001320EAA8|nr:hypothetical protein [Actinophytocola sp.]MPZ79924.1 hypothetical protein [Actinophytocola sp.]
MDERKLAELLHDAVADAPPPSFDQRDVAAGSERQRIRRRNGVLTGSAFGVVLLASATALGVALWTGPHSADQTNAAEAAAAGGNGSAAPNELPQEDSAGAPKAERELVPQDAPSETRKQGRPPSGDAGPAGPGSTPSGCKQADRELAAALAGELPAAAKIRAEDAIPVELWCPEGAKGAAFRVSDQGHGGTISVIRVQPDTTPPEWATPAGTRSGLWTASDDSTYMVLSEPLSAGGVAPFGSAVQHLATEVGRA